ncbi:MAG: phage holin family protein [Pseudomonadota bacterium]
MRDGNAPSAETESNPSASADDADAVGAVEDAKTGIEGDEEDSEAPPPLFDDSISGEIATLIDDGRNYAQAEIAFQKIRAKLAGKHIAIALACAIVAIVLLHIAFLALAVGLVIALAPLVTIWGAIGIVVGALIVLVIVLGLFAKSNGQRLASLFASDSEGEAS